MLDTKLKSSKTISKWGVGIFSFLVIGIISGWIYSQYDKIGQIANQQAGSVYDNSELYEYLSQMSYTLYYDALKHEQKELSLDQLIEISRGNYEELFEEYWPYNTTGIGFDEFYTLSADEQNKILQRILLPVIEEDLFNLAWNQFQNLDYLAIMPLAKFKTGNLNLEPLLNANLMNSELESLKNQYQSFVVLNYDSTGRLSITNSYEFDSSPSTYRSVEYTDGYELAPIKDMTFIYAIPTTLTYSDYIWQTTHQYDWWSIQGVVGWFSWIAIALTAITAIILPINTFKQGKFFNWILKNPFEIMICFSMCLFPVFIEVMPSLVYATLEEMILNDATYLMFPESVQYIIVPILNIVMWTAVLYWVLIDVIYIKNLFKIGLKETIKTKFISINLLRWIRRKGRSCYDSLTGIDLKDANTKKLALFLGIQYVIISIFCVTFIFGLPVVIIYCVGLFVFLNKKLKKVESDYSKLLTVTNELAEGNLDIQVNQDLGIFNSFKDEVVNIQGGLKKAVENEVKSQRMKTDLIANVSHDLKTPLTSIITYVDLLKDETLSQEKRQQYLETLEQKSYRLKILIEDLFEMSKASSGNISMNLQMVDVVSLMKQTLLETEDKIQASGLVIRRQFPDYKVMLSLDSDRTFRVFENLITNMIKYAMSGTRAYVDIVDNEESVQIIFRNMSAEEITVNVDELVERFVRGDQSRHTEGSGLGLAIAKSFVELQKGSFEILVDGDLFKVIITFSK